MPLAPKVLDTLLVLIAHRDRVVTKDELLERVWDGTAVEEGGLTRNISVLRKALGEKPDEHTYIVTVPGKGYRFVADVREVQGLLQSGPDEAARRPRSRPGRRARSAPWLLFGGLAALVAGVLAVLPFARRRPSKRGDRRLPRWPYCRWTICRATPAQEYFADGMTEALIGNLARIRALRVVSRTSVMRFKGATRPLSEIAQALNVDAIVEGSVQRTGDRVRISVQLIHAATDTHLWAREYERDLTDILKLQGEVARAQLPKRSRFRSRQKSVPGWHRRARSIRRPTRSTCWASIISGG